MRTMKLVKTDNKSNFSLDDIELVPTKTLDALSLFLEYDLYCILKKEEECYRSPISRIAITTKQVAKKKEATEALTALALQCATLDGIKEIKRNYVENPTRENSVRLFRLVSDHHYISSSRFKSFEQKTSIRIRKDNDQKVKRKIRRKNDEPTNVLTKKPRTRK